MTADYVAANGPRVPVAVVTAVSSATIKLRQVFIAGSKS